MNKKKDYLPSTRGLDDDELKGLGLFETPPVAEPIPAELVNPTPSISVLPNPPQPDPDAPAPDIHAGDQLEYLYTKILESGPGFLAVATDKGNFILSNGTLSWRNHNPGNMRYGTFSSEHGAIGKDYKGFAVFPSYIMGKNAQKALLFDADSAYYKLDLLKALRKYAPASDGNNPKDYAVFISKKIAAERTTPLYKLTPEQQDGMLEAMKTMEGYKLGTVKPYLKG